MLHTLAYTKLVTAGTTNEQLNGVTDSWASLQNNAYLLPRACKTMAAYAQGTSITNAQVNAPTLRVLNLPAIQPVNVGTAPLSRPPINIFPPGQYTIQNVDELAFNTSNNLGASTERHIAGLWVGDANLNIPQGDIIPCLATSSNTGAALIWTAGTITFAQTLPKGRYAVVGMDAIGANLIFARLRFSDGGPLPGCLARQAISDVPDWNFRWGRMGTWGEFEHTAVPTIDIFPSATGTTQTFILDLVKIR